MIRDPVALEAKALKVTNVTQGHAKRQRNVVRDLDRVNGNVLAVLQAWIESFAPSTVCSYAVTLRKQCPHLFMPGSQASIVFDQVRQKSGVLTTRRAISATPEHVAAALSVAPSPHHAATLAAMWVSLARHSDLTRAKVTTFPQPGIVFQQWDTWKSDRYGTRAFAKFFRLPRQLQAELKKGWASYDAIRKVLKIVDPRLTVHSLRRGGATHLSNLGTPFKEIQL
ncbi:MAG: hypothetical protein GY700_01980, partial [Propionibacteriaceae bacterium]|nr:hypothetical protein [Propionibacteriaceae bacterium]